MTAAAKILGRMRNNPTGWRIEDLMKRLSIPSRSAVCRRQKGRMAGGVPRPPGCIADGETIEEAVENTSDAMRSWLATAKEFRTQSLLPRRD